jgi:hypothetical protein
MAPMRVLAAIFATLVATPGVHHTPAGMAVAKKTLLRRADLGAGWVAGATPKKVGTLACRAPTQLSHVVETGAAVSPTYRAGSSGPFVSGSTFAYDSPGGAARYFDEIAKRSALACLAQSLTSGSSNGGVVFTVRKREVLPAPQLRVSAAAYRVVGTAKVSAQKVTVYADVVLLQHGTTIAQVSLASFAAPVGKATEARIARAAAARL